MCYTAGMNISKIMFTAAMAAGLAGAAAAAANPGLRVHTAPFFTGTGLMQVYSGVGVTLIIR